MKDEDPRWYDRSVPPLSHEIRLLIAYYLIFLSLLAGWNAGTHSRPMTTEVTGTWGAFYQDAMKGYDLRELVQRADQDVEQALRGEGIAVNDRLWRLKDRKGTPRVVWTESEYKGNSQLAEDVEPIKKHLDNILRSYGISCRSAQGIQLGQEIHYRLIYGLIIGKTEIVTHRISLTFVGAAPQKKPTLGLAPVPREIPTKKEDITKKEDGSKLLIRPQISTEASQESLAPRPSQKPTPTIRQPVISDERPRNTGVKVAIIIDDFGFVKDEAEAYFSIHEPLTIAVMPGGKYSREHAIRAAQLGFEVILHQPLEPSDRSVNPGPGLIASDLADEEIIHQFHTNLEDVPGARGFNNHMGSKGTQDRRIMRMLLFEAKRNGLFYIDSRTIAGTIGETVARDLGVAHASRDVFLDHYGVDRVREQLDQLVKVAIKKGEAIGIAHARSGVAEIIEAYLPVIKKAGIQIVPVSELLR